MDMCLIVDAFRMHFCNNICRLPTSPDTKRIDGKHQEEPPDIFRNVQDSNANKNADTKAMIDNLQFAECNQLHQTPIVKNGGRR